MRHEHISFAYVTNRREPMIKWFFDSLHRELDGEYVNRRVIVVDFYAEEPGRREHFQSLARCSLVHVPPKPTPWQGKHRLTTKDYFAASTARNTAICHAPDGWIVFCDDLSVLMPGWMCGVKDAIHDKYCVLGAYRKVFDLRVENGHVVNFRDNQKGHDSRWYHGHDNHPVRSVGSALFGCSFGLPVDWLLKTNGLDEAADGLGFEDVLLGIALQHHGVKFQYDRRMLTFESEERHGDEATLPKFNRKNVQGAQDAAWALLTAVTSGGRHTFPNYFPEGGIAEMRKHILAGGQFPTGVNPQHYWADGTPLSEI